MSATSATVNKLTFEEAGGWPAVLSLVTSSKAVPGPLLSAAFSEILEGRATPAQIAGLAIGLRTKGETLDELQSALATMLSLSIAVPLAPDIAARAIDTCGTGGDRSHSVNVSTMAAFVVAGAGVPVCKHGGRAASSASGSADVLEALGVALELTPEAVARCVNEAGIGFCLAPRFHPAMRHAAPVRRELGVATLFNFLGPLANPGRVRHQVVGVSDENMAPKLAGVLAARGTRAWVVRGEDGLDELSTTGPSRVWDVRAGIVTEARVDPAALGLSLTTLAGLRGGSPQDNAAVTRSVLGGAKGPHRDVVVLNAAAALVVAGVAEDLSAGMAQACAVIEDGRAETALADLVRVSQREAASAA